MATANRKRAANPNIEQLGSRLGNEANTASARSDDTTNNLNKTDTDDNLNKLDEVNKHYTDNNIYSVNSGNESVYAGTASGTSAATQIPEPGTGRVGRPRTTVRNGPSKSRGLQPGLERFSVVMDSAQVETLRDIAWNSRRSLKDLVGEAISALIAATDEADKAPRPKK